MRTIWFLLGEKRPKPCIGVGWRSVVSPRTLALAAAQALAAALIAVTPAAAAPIPGGLFISQYSCETLNPTGFGTCSGSFPDTGDNGLLSGEAAWFLDHFGMFARASANSTDRTGSDTAGASGIFTIELLVPPQQGLAAGALAYFRLPYHLDGTVSVDWGDNFVSTPGGLVNTSITNIDFVWFSNVADGATGTQTTQRFENLHYTGNNHFSATINDNLLVQAPITVGQSFFLTESVVLTVHGESRVAPTIGFVQGDFLHTATIGPATILDSSFQPISNPLILSATGFDFANPNAAGPGPGGSVPGPGALAMVASGGLVLAIRRYWRKSEGG